MNIIESLEKAILGCFLLKDNFHQYKDKLTSDCFKTNFHREIYCAMYDLHEENLNIDPLTVLSRLSHLENIDESYIYSLIDEVPSVNNIDSYIYELCEHNSRKDKDNG